jgi:hypothetical protein
MPKSKMLKNDSSLSSEELSTGRKVGTGVTGKCRLGSIYIQLLQIQYSISNLCNEIYIS